MSEKENEKKFLTEVDKLILKLDDIIISIRRKRKDRKAKTRRTNQNSKRKRKRTKRKRRTRKLEENYGDKCTICMDEFQVGLNIYRTPCEHIFHTNCFDKYLKGINKKDKLICPNCNQNLLINKKYMKLRAKKEEIINQRYINKEDGGKEIIIKNSLSITDHEQM